MMKTRMTRLLTLALCLVMCLMPLTASAFAPVDLSHAASLTLVAKDEETALPGANFSLYRVAEMNADAQFVLASAYSGFTGDINALEHASDWVSAAAYMDGVAKTQTATVTGTTDDAGAAKFASLTPGLYLVTGAAIQVDPWQYAFTPFLASVPTRNAADEWVYDVQADVKFERTVGVTDLEVVKIWEDDGVTSRRPDELEITLLADGVAIQQVLLNKANNWSYLFKELPIGPTYTVEERNVPNGYTVSYRENNGALVIENTYTVVVTPEPDLPQTGQLTWPIPVLAGLGMVLFVVGWIINRKWSQEHEEP